MDDKELNAFALPGGFIYVHSGLMNKTTDAELACVIAHEIGHVAAKHAVKKMQVNLGYQLLLSIAFNKASSSELSSAVNTAFNIISLGYSREDEKLADRLAVKYAQKADFDPRAMISFFEKLKDEERKKGVSYHIVFLESHPAIEERINNVKKEINALETKTTPISTKDQPEGSACLSGRQGLAYNISQSHNGTTIQPKEINSTNPKKCPKCQKIYPANINFCVKDGTRLTP